MEILSDVADASLTANWGSPPPERFAPLANENNDNIPFICLDAAALGDIPARYTITCVREYELPAIGVYVDPRIVPGFRYKVRILPDPAGCDHRCKQGNQHKLDHLFNGKSLRLLSIGRGYCRRMVFEPNPGNLNDNENYFWTDSHPGGFALEVNVISAGDQFSVLDENQCPVGLVEVFEVIGSQQEISETMTSEYVKKDIAIKFHCKAEKMTANDSKETLFTTITGLAECVKNRGAKLADLKNIHSLKIGNEAVTGLSLVPLKDR